MLHGFSVEDRGCLRYSKDLRQLAENSSTLRSTGEAAVFRGWPRAILVQIVDPTGPHLDEARGASVSQDLARFGQAGPKHGSAPIGGATDFLPVLLGCENAMISGSLCETWSAHKAYRLGMLTGVVPALKIDGKFVGNPLVTLDRYSDEFGQIVHGEFKTGADLEAGRALMAKGQIDLSLLDAKVEELCAKILMTFPDCFLKTILELRKPKLNAWNANKDNSRDWLALNMMTEARLGFRAFNEGARDDREADFVGLRQALAKGAPWSDKLTESLMPKSRRTA